MLAACVPVAALRAARRDDEMRLGVERPERVLLRRVVRAAHESIELDAGLADRRQLAGGGHEDSRATRFPEGAGLAPGEVDGVDAVQLLPAAARRRRGA